MSDETTEVKVGDDGVTVKKVGEDGEEVKVEVAPE